MLGRPDRLSPGPRPPRLPGLDDLYLDATEAGVEWLLSPTSDVVTSLAIEADTRTPAHRCDPIALCADLDDLEHLISCRHFGIATGELDSDLVSGILERWRNRLSDERPPTWGQALGLSVHELRWALRDNHLSAVGEDEVLLATADSRRNEPRLEREPGPVVEESMINGVLCIRIRQCGGRSQASQDVVQAWQQAHERHFDHDRIVVDLRQNPGGGDWPIIGWIREHVATEVVWPPWREWRIGDHALNLWNASVIAEATLGEGALADEYDRSGFHLGASVRLEVADNPFSIPAGPSPWRGRMLVFTDAGSASAAESGAWMLREGLSARLIGGRTAGAVSFGNLAPYLLPRSGLKIDLPTASASRHEESMVGVPVDLSIDVRTPLEDVATSFEVIYDRASMSAGAS